MADFPSWDRPNLVAFCQDAAPRLMQIEDQLQQLKQQLAELKGEIDDMRADRRLLLERWRQAELRAGDPLKETAP